MKQSFKYEGLTIEVRAETGLDLIDKPMLNRIVADAIQGEADTDISLISPLVWNRISSYARFLQLSTVKGKGLNFPTMEDMPDAIGKGYEAWIAFISEHVDCYRQWDKALSEVNKETVDTDPQADSAEKKSEIE